jgi:ketosteroid isomerase-like protein
VTTGDESERVVRRVYEVLQRGGSVPELMEELEPLLAPDAEWVNPEHAIERGTRVGPDGWRTALENTQGGLGANVVFHLDDLQVLGEGRVFARGQMRTRGTSSGVEVEGPKLAMYWTLRDGRVSRMEWSFEVEELLARARTEASA